MADFCWQVYQSVPIYHAAQRLDIAGRGELDTLTLGLRDTLWTDITEELCKHLNADGYTFQTSAEREIARDIKEKLCEVSEEGVSSNSASPITYTLPDGHSTVLCGVPVDLCRDIHRRGEVYFP